LTYSEKEFFDEMAVRYPLYAILVPEASQFRNMLLDKAMKKTLTPILKSFRKMLVLDLGCGVGRWSGIMSAQNSVVGVDLSRYMIKAAKNSCKSGDCSFVVADISFLPFRENVFDLVVSITVLQHILDAKKFSRALEEISKCGRAEFFFAEEMWSRKETILHNVYCPIRILPVESYLERISATGLHANHVGGITYAPLTIFLTHMFESRTRSLNTMSRVKASRTISRLVHFVLGIGIFSAVLMPIGNHNPCLSLHTIVRAKKCGRSNYNAHGSDSRTCS
jgi:SAM-dependent methyltransferase